MPQPKRPLAAKSAGPQRQLGAALLLAMVIVCLVATMASSMVWQQWRATQVETAERVRAQADWVLQGALDWARLILREDARSSDIDHLGEPWAIPLAEARLSTFLAADQDNNAGAADDGPDVFLSGQISDAQAQYNLRNVLDGNGEIQPEELAVLKSLCQYAGVAPSVAQMLASQWRLAWLAAQAVPSQSETLMAKLGGNDAVRRAPLLPQTYDQLRWLGLAPDNLERLRPYLRVLPETTQVNVNTAPREVLAAVIDGLDLARAGRIVQSRASSPFKVTTDVTKVVGAGNWNFSRLDVRSNYFEVLGRLRSDDSVIEQRYLVQRIGQDAVEVRSQIRFTGVDLGADSPLRP